MFLNFWGCCLLEQETYVIEVVEHEGELMLRVEGLLFDRLSNVGFLGWDAVIVVERDEKEILSERVYEYGTHAPSPVVNDPANVFGQGGRHVDRIDAKWLVAGDVIRLTGKRLPYGIEKKIRQSYLFLRGADKLVPGMSYKGLDRFAEAIREGEREFVKENGAEAVLGPVLRFIR